MKIVGLITEYNPFHAGHLYHMQKAKELTGADYCVVLMSGSFVQRGEPAVFDKYRRAKAALLAGADLVLEMPAAFSTASAHEFAAYGVALLSAVGVDAIVFGSECGQIEWLKKAAYLLNHESPEFQARLQAGLKEGLTYPQARAKAFEEDTFDAIEKHPKFSAFFSEDTKESANIGTCENTKTLRGISNASKSSSGDTRSEAASSSVWMSVLNSPNNILGIEYLRAAELLHSPVEFYTITREGSRYHEENLAETSFPSASAIRKKIQETYNTLAAGNGSQGESHFISSTILTAESYLPAVTYPAYAGAVPVFTNDFSELLNAAVLQMQTGGRLSQITDTDSDMSSMAIADLSPELAARLAKPPYRPLSFEERIQALKTRQLTYTRVSRALLHLVLGMQEEDIFRWKEDGYALYARILGFRRQSSALLSCLHKKSSIPLITKMADAAQILSPSALALLEQEVYASHLYQTVRMKRGGVFQNEYTEGLVFV